MARASPNQTSFSGGEFSPLLYGRTDADRFKTGLKTCLNMIPTIQGAATRRGGTKYVATTAFVTDTVKLLPFVYSNTQAYILEFTDSVIRFYTNHGLILDGGSPYQIASPYLAADLSGLELKYCQSLDVLYLFHPNYMPRKLQRYGNTDWILVTLDPQDGPYLRPGYPANRCQVTSLTNLGQLNTSAFAVGATTLTTIAGSYAALAITTIANNGAGLCRVTFAGADEFANRSQIFLRGCLGTVEANGTWTVNKITSTQYDLIGSAFVNPYGGGGLVAPAPFKSTDVGRLVRMKIGANNWGWAKITAFSTGATVTADINSTLAAAGTTSNFRFGLWNDEDGYPSCGVFHEDRLCMGGVGSQRIDGSATSDYEDFAPTALDGTIVDSNAISFTLNSDKANSIYWLASDERGMPVGTSGGPWILRPSILSEALTPTNVSAKRVNNIGSKDAMSVLAGKSSIYIEASGRKLREMSYFYDVDGFRSIDISEIAEHLPSVGIQTELAYQATPQPVIWCARNDGYLLGTTYDRNLDALRTGWHKHVLGGVSDTSGTPPIVKSVAVIPSPNGDYEELWMVVKRYINGLTIHTIEYMTKIFEEYDEQDDAYFLDCGYTDDNPKTVTAITSANPAVVTTSTAHGYVAGDKIRFKGISGLKDVDGVDQINTILYEVAAAPAPTAFTFAILGLDSTALTAFTAGGVVRKQVSSVAAVGWLEGQSVSIVGDGSYLGEATVTAGVVNLPYPAGKIHIGLRYNSDLQQLRIDAGASDGTSLGKNKRIEQTALMINRSGSFQIGMDFDTMYDGIIRDALDPTDQAAPLFSGIKDRIELPSNYDLDNQIAIRVHDPVPFTLLSVMPQVTTYDKG